MSRPFPPLLAAAAVALLPAALSACPAELGAGLVYVSDDGSTTTVTPTDRPDVLRERVVFAEGDGYELEALFGLFELTTADFDAGGPVEATRETSTYAMPPALPGPGASLQGIEARVVTATGDFARRHDVQAGSLGDVSLGGCAVQGYQIEIRVVQPDLEMTHRFIRVPALGVAFYTGFQDSDGPETFQITSVTPLAAPAPAK